MPGGALILAEKLLAVTPMMQDAITFPYYDGKLRRGFDAQHVLDKERSLRGVMTCWTLDELVGKLRRVGFGPIQIIWAHYLVHGLRDREGTVASAGSGAAVAVHQTMTRKKQCCSKPREHGRPPPQNSAADAAVLSIGPIRVITTAGCKSSKDGVLKLSFGLLSFFRSFIMR